MTPDLPDAVLRHLRDVAEMPDLEGGRYRVDGEIGRGGAGVVYRAFDEVLGRDVALKVMPGPLDEARLAARLEHPNIVPVHDAGELADGRVFHVMKLVEGERLDEFARTAPLSGRLRAFRKICDAVAYAHARGVVHRDLKPANIMTGRFGEVFVMDWSAHAAGTPGFMAPESPRGAKAADIYSMGRLLEFLVGAGPPKPLRAIADKASAAAADARYASVEELAAEVDRYAERLPVLAYREPVWERAARFAARNATLLLLGTTWAAVKVLIYFLLPR